MVTLPIRVLGLCLQLIKSDRQAGAQVGLNETRGGTRYTLRFKAESQVRARCFHVSTLGYCVCAILQALLVWRALQDQPGLQVPQQVSHVQQQFKCQ
jgi:hypothetical protein